MQITEVRVKMIRDNAKVRGYASIVLDDCFIVRNITILTGSQGLYVAMPSRKRRDGSFQDVAHPINNETRLIIENAVLDEYQRCFDEEEVHGQSA
jgi:stage V sporulation protein G